MTVRTARAARLLTAAALVLGCAIATPASATATATATARGHHGHGHHGPKGPHGKVVWGPTSFYAGTPVTAHGRVPRGRAKVKLQVKLPGGWHSFAATRSSRKGRFSIQGDLSWYGNHKVRITTSGRHRFKRTTTVSAFITYAARGNAADHVFLQQDGVRYSFNPCHTVRYVVNVDDVGPSGLLLAQVAMAQASLATGIRVQYVGTSHQIPFQAEETRLPAGQDMLIAFADEAEIPRFVTTPAIGFGGPVQVHPALDGSRRPVWETTQAAAVFDTNAWFSGTYDWSFQSAKPNWGETMLHEFGHAFGLDHSPAADEIMYWQAGNGVYPDGLFRGLYDAGDLAGLATNGLGQGCFHRVGRFREGAPARLEAPQPLP